MDYLFDERHQERVEEASRVQEMDVSEIAVFELSPDDVEMLDSEPGALEAIPYHDDSVPPDAPEAPEVSGPMPKQSREKDSEAPPAEAEAPETSADGRDSFKTTAWVLFGIVTCCVLLYVLSYYTPIGEMIFGGGGADASSEGTEEPAQPEAEGEGETEAESESETEAESETETETESEAEGETGAEGETESEGEPSASTRRGRARRGGGGGATEPARATTGPLTITARPGWADVYLGSQHLGRTPVRRDLPIGTHRLSIRPNGDASAAESITVVISAVSGESLSLDIPAQ